MRKAHSHLSSAGDFTAEQGHMLIHESTGADGDTSKRLFAIMRVMGYIIESSLGKFRAADNFKWN
jgi:hypothetical protein